MATGRYATLSPLPISTSTVQGMELVFKSLLQQRRREGRSGDILDESYAKVTDHGSLPGVNFDSNQQQAVSMGSAWVLECRKNHGFHYHTFSDQDPALSFRRLLLVATRGLTAEIFPYDPQQHKAVGPLERFVMQGPAFAELEFDGRMVHRFRPINDGTLYAYSVHHRDVSSDDHVASTQTHPVNGVMPDEVIEHGLESSSC